MVEKTGRKLQRVYLLNNSCRKLRSISFGLWSPSNCICQPSANYQSDANYNKQNKPEIRHTNWKPAFTNLWKMAAFKLTLVNQNYPETATKCLLNMTTRLGNTVDYYHRKWQIQLNIKINCYSNEERFLKIIKNLRMNEVPENVQQKSSFSSQVMIVKMINVDGLE